MIHEIGDRVVPISAGIHLANALNLFGYSIEEWKPRLDQLKEWGVLYAIPVNEEGQSDPDGKLYDVDDVRQSRSFTQSAIGPFPSISILDGIGAVRFADVEGDHEWIAGYQRDGFNYGRYTLRQISSFHRCGGRFFLEDHPDCLQAEECAQSNELHTHPLCRSEYLRSARSPFSLSTP